MLGALGRNAPSDFDHVTRKPLSALGELAPTCEPVCLAGNWYSDFDTPQQLADGSWHLPSAKHIRGRVRGGHNTTLAQMGALRKLNPLWWMFYDQGAAPACEGVGHAQRESLRRGTGTFDGFWLYDQARKAEGTYPDGEGTTSRAVCEVLLSQGLRTQGGEQASEDPSLDGPVDRQLGISAVRWATTAEEVCNALGRPHAWAVPLLNQWGTSYPRVVWLPVDTLERILAEDGEADVVTDR